jgi:hypothetical protein
MKFLGRGRIRPVTVFVDRDGLAGGACAKNIRPIIEELKAEGGNLSRMRRSGNLMEIVGINLAGNLRRIPLSRNPVCRRGLAKTP